MITFAWAGTCYKAQKSIKLPLIAVTVSFNWRCN